MAIGIVSTSEKTLDLSTAAIGLQVTAPFVLISKKLGKTKSADARDYYDLVFKNERGQTIVAKAWSEDVEVWRDVDPGVPCMIKGKLEAYPKDLPKPNQIKIQEIVWLEPDHPVVAVMNDHSPIAPEDLAAEFDAIIGSFRHPGYKRAAELYFTDICPRERFLTAPAAKGHHHAYIGGLAEHTFEMRRIALAMAVQPVIRDHVNIDLISLGTFIHDSGKLFEYQWEGVPIGMHPDALLFNHMTTGPMMVSQLMERHGEELEALGFGWDDAKHLIHIIVSHHGKLEHGAPTVPGTLEAQIIHQADVSSAAVRGVLNTMTSVEPDRHGVYAGKWPNFGFRQSPPSFDAASDALAAGESAEGVSLDERVPAMPLDLRLDRIVDESRQPASPESVPSEPAPKARARAQAV